MKRSKLKTAPFDIAEYLDDEKIVAEYLSEAIADGNPAVFLKAIGDIAKARGMTEIAEKAGLGRESLYKAFAEGAKPRHETVLSVLRALGFKISIEIENDIGTAQTNGAKRKSKTSGPATVSSDSAFHALGLENADDLVLRSRLLRKIGKIVESMKLSPAEFGDRIGVGRARASALLAGKISRFSTGNLAEALARLERSVGRRDPKRK